MCGCSHHELIYPLAARKPISRTVRCTCTSLDRHTV
jgi:hypothetical protein